MESLDVKLHFVFRLDRDQEFISNLDDDLYNKIRNLIFRNHSDIMIDLSFIFENKSFDYGEQ